MVPIRIVTETLGGEVSWNDATKTVTLKIDGKEITMTIDKVLEAYGVAPQIMNDRTYVPIRFVVDEIGAEVNWNGSLQKKIMGIALPNGIENGVHQLVKVALSSMVGDVKFTMITSITLTIAARLAFSALFGLVLGWGVTGIAIGMSMNLVFRGIIFIRRYHSQKWTKFHLI